MNELLFLLSIIVYFSLVTLCFKLFGRVGLFVWIAIAMILSNIEVLKLVDMFGMTNTLGNVIYGTTYLVTDIISERYGKDEAKKTVYIGFFAVLAFTLMMQLVLLFQPNIEDFVDGSLYTIFSLAPRISFAAIFTYVIMQRLDIFLYHKIKEKTAGKKLWLRNNLSTAISQLADSTLFTLLAFTGIYSADIIIELIFATYLLKLIVIACDTPFLYLCRNMKENILKI